jgi:hypothetical protein
MAANHNAVNGIRHLQASVPGNSAAAFIDTQHSSQFALSAVLRYN